MSRLVLMYHGIHGDQHALDQMPLEDRPYAVSAADFDAHLALLADKPVSITFDDGDAGWALHAASLLARHNLTALFFVTPELIGKPGYCSWDQLKQLVAAGHRLGSHGLTHRFLPDLSEQDCRHELEESRRLIEQHTGAEVTELSFPGGRYGARELRIARELGYQHCHTSEPGRDQSGAFEVPRVAVRATTSSDWLTGLAGNNRKIWWRLLLVNALKRGLKRLLGNQGYHRLYRLLRGA